MEARIGKSHDVAATSWSLCDEQIVVEPRDSFAFHCTQPITGSLIMVQLLQNGIIYACEIQVYGHILCEYSHFSHKTVLLGIGQLSNERL